MLGRIPVLGRLMLLSELTRFVNIMHLLLKSGVNLMQFQEALDTRRIGMRAAKSYQLEFRNTQGRIKLIGHRVNHVDTRNGKGIEI